MAPDTSTTWLLEDFYVTRRGTLFGLFVQMLVIARLRVLS
ncbi:hypothetical protein LINPERHAP2_LOCUS40664 [Linum perenne]